MALGLTSGRVSDSSGSPLDDRHKNLNLHESESRRLLHGHSTPTCDARDTDHP